MLIGYARVSTHEQSLNLQQDALEKAGCERTFTDVASGATAERDGLSAAFDYVRAGDTLVVWRLDRLGRSLKQLIDRITVLEQRGVGFRSLTESMDTTTSGGRLIFHVFGALAEFERAVIRERTLAGLAAARARGRCGGRPKSMNETQIAMAKAMLADRELPVRKVYEALHVSRATLYRHLSADRAPLGERPVQRPRSRADTVGELARVSRHRRLPMLRGPMSLKPSSIPPVPAETAAVVRAAFRRAPLPVRLRDEFGALYEDADFAALFPVRGQPALPPWRLALVTVLQFVEGLSDRQAADAVRARIDWKYALSLELSDPGFDYSVLSEFRARLVASGHEQVLLDRLLEHAATRGLVKARTPQRTDSTHVLAAVRTLNRLELVGESVRAALNALAAAAPDWLRGVAPPEWHARYDHRVEGSRQPTPGPARERLLRTLGEDGTALLAAVGAPNAPPMLRELPAVAALRRVLARYYAREPSGPDGHDADVDAGTGVLRPRTRGELARAPRAVESPYEADARSCGRSGLEWVGYTRTLVHLSETCAPGLPRLVTHVDTTPAGAYEATRVDAIHAALAAKGLLPAVHLADGAYISAALLVRSARANTA